MPDGLKAFPPAFEAVHPVCVKDAPPAFTHRTGVEILRRRGAASCLPGFFAKMRREATENPEDTEKSGKTQKIGKAQKSGNIQENREDTGNREATEK